MLQKNFAQNFSPTKQALTPATPLRKEVAFKHDGLTIWLIMTLRGCGTLAHQNSSHSATAHRHIHEDVASIECPLLHAPQEKDRFSVAFTVVSLLSSQHKHRVMMQFIQHALVAKYCGPY